VSLDDLVRTVKGTSQDDSPLVEILLMRADTDGGRACNRVLTDAEIDRLLAGDEPEGGSGVE
jgi:hypothetical protein